MATHTIIEPCSRWRVVSITVGVVIGLAVVAITVVTVAGMIIRWQRGEWN